MADIRKHLTPGTDSADLLIERVDRTEDHRPVVEQWGLRGRHVPQAVPPKISSDQSGMYFEVYQVPEMHLTAILRSGGDWRWRFCAADGGVAVTSGSYPSKIACIVAIDILRGGAGTADLMLIKRA